MKRIKKFIAPVLCAVIILCGFIVLTGLKTVKVANAETNRQLTVEDYTNSDNLLKSDGTPSVKTIDEFAAEVKAADYDTEIPELSQVIPVEYLDKDIEGTFAYNGLEYGFYMVKYDLFFDFILIDFDYVSKKDTDLEYKIRIEPILQESFYCQENSDGTYKWVKYGVIEKYFVSNPRFVSVLLNENSLNYGDDEYDKLQDDGLIITQSRTNYGKVCYATEKDLTNTIGQFLGNKLVDFAFDKFCDLVDKATYGVGGKILGIMKDFKELGDDIYEAGKETVVVADNENNIFTEMSKSAQRENSRIPGYSRIVGFTPQEEIVLSDADNSYAEFIVVLNNADSRSRLLQFCDFDLVKRKTAYSSMEKVVENLTFSKERVLFNNKSITPLNENCLSQQNSAYLLPNGNQKFTYNCNDTTTYQIKAEHKLSDISIYNGNTRVSATKVNDKLVEFSLEAGNKYTFEFSQNVAANYNFTFCKKPQDITALGQQPVRELNAGESAWFKYTTDKDKYLNIGIDNSKYFVACYRSDDGEIIDLIESGNQKEFFASNGQVYYIQVTNSTSSNLSGNMLTFDNVETLPLNTAKTGIVINNQKTYLLNIPFESRYRIEISNNITALINGTFISTKDCIISAGDNYLTLIGNTVSGQCFVGFNSQDIEVHGGQSRNYVGNAKNIVLKFTPKQTLNCIDIIMALKHLFLILITAI